MSGPVANNIFKASGVIAAAAGGLSWQPVVTSNFSAAAGKGYWVNTTSNTITITLPSSPSKGDQIILVDYARTWATYKIIIDSNGSNYQGQDDTYTVEYSTNGEVVNIVYSDGTKGWIPQDDDEVADATSPPPTQKGIFAYGVNGGYYSLSNLVNSSGAIAADVTGVGTERGSITASNYGGDKALFVFGAIEDVGVTNLKNLINNQGVASADVTGVGTARQNVGAAGYSSSA